MSDHFEREHQLIVFEKPSNNNNTITEFVNNNNNITLPEKRNNENNHNVSAYEKHSHIDIGPRNVCKTFYMLKIIEKKDSERPIHIITRSPNQYPNYKTSNQ